MESPEQSTSRPGKSGVQETTIEGTFHHVLHADAIDQEFSIDVALPMGAAKRRCSVVYLTDANWNFAMVNATRHLLQLGKEIPPLILVGIGYPDSSQVLAHRTRDLTPTQDMDYVPEGGKPLPAYIKPGGADDFLDFIATTVKPFIEQNYRTKLGQDTLAGFSLGGLFAAHALFTGPTDYRRYIIGSPSIWWDSSVLFATEQEYAERHKDLDASVFMSIGGLEQPRSETMAKFQMVSNMRIMAERLVGRNYPSLELTTHEFEGETHMSVIPATFSRALREVFKD